MVALEMGILSREWWETGQASRTPQEKKKRWKGKKGTVQAFALTWHVFLQ